MENTAMSITVIKERIAKEIADSGIKQCDIARQLNVHPSLITQYLNGRSAPGLDTFAKLCVILDVSADYLLGITDYSGRKKQ